MSLKMSSLRESFSIRHIDSTKTFNRFYLPISCDAQNFTHLDCLQETFDSFLDLRIQQT